MGNIGVGNGIKLLLLSPQKLTGSSKRKATKASRKRNASNGESSSSSSSSFDSAVGPSPPTSKFPRRS